MVEVDIKRVLQEHNIFFQTERTKTLEFRIEQLQKLKNIIMRYEKEIINALYKDLNKSEFEAYGTEIGFTLDSLRYMLKNLKRWMKHKNVKTPLHQFPAKSYIMKEPYGTVLIIGPFNYPFQLVIEPLIGAIAAGNCVVLKPSENTPHVSGLIKKMMKEAFDEEYIRVIEGEKEVNSILIHAPFNYIFFTGSVPVGKIVMEAAAQNLVPVTLELGGKSPVIVDETANLEIAAKRIIWGKVINAGQTCIAPDYVIAHAKIKDALIDKMKEAVISFYGTDASKSEDYGRIVNERQFDRLAEIIEKDRNKVIFGGNVIREDLYIQPTILDGINWEDASMLDENFGPILPILEFNHLEEAINMINDRPKPLALYIFTENKLVEAEVLSKVSFGGGCVNDTVSHVASTHLPFGGVGNSGMGAYHGKHSFELFSHSKSILKKSTKFELGIVFPPYKNKIKLVKKLLK